MALLIGHAHAGTHYFYNDGSNNWQTFTSWSDFSRVTDWSCESYSSTDTNDQAEYFCKGLCDACKIWNYSTVFGTGDWHYACCDASTRRLQLRDDSEESKEEEGAAKSAAGLRGAADWPCRSTDQGACR